MLSQTGNINKLASPAEDYLAEVSEKFPKAIRLQSTPSDRELWKIENYEKFLEARRQMLAGELNNFLNGLVDSVDTSIETSLEELIAEGESSDLEFKSSLRWDLKENRADKKIGGIALKAIAALSNGEGGTLLIGVNDEGKILGLDYDYASLDGSKDEFELHLRDLIKTSFGVNFATNNITVSFPEVDENEICHIQIKKGLEPQYLEVADKGGVKSKKFYVRSGNSSVEVPIEEVAVYINTRFNGK